MTTQQKLVQKKLSLLELGEYLQNVSEACRIHGCSRQHFYDIKKAYESQGLAGLQEKTRRNMLISRFAMPTWSDEPQFRQGMESRLGGGPLRAH